MTDRTEEGGRGGRVEGGRGMGRERRRGRRGGEIVGREREREYTLHCTVS
jgi:hypothetical protein